MGLRRQAFTLFEVMISLMVITIAILSTLMILPVGLRAEHLARSQLIAASTALTLFENFHNPLVSFRGHGALAPDLTHNLNVATPNAPPIPGWANRLRDLDLTSSTYQPDFEHMLSGWVQGISPVPLVISRRLDSDGDEIQNILDQGGYLFYTDPSFVRGLSITANHDTSPVINPPPESQKLVFAVRGYAQENTLPSHPLESLPWYEIYPFPPEWVALRCHGHEYRRGPIDLVARWDNAAGGWTYLQPSAPNTPQNWSPTQEGRTYNYSRVWVVNDQNIGGHSGGSRDGLEYGDSGMHSVYSGVTDVNNVRSGWNPVWFDPAPSNYQMLNLNGGQLANYANNPIDADDPNDAQATPAMAAWYHGRNWRYFHEQYPGSPWDLGWVAFEKLAGFNWDVGGSMSQLQYAQTDPSNTNLTHYERAGWLPCMACLLNPEEPSFDGEWWNIQPPSPAPRAAQNINGGWTWPVSPVAPDPGNTGAIAPNGYGYLPATPPNDTNLQFPPSDQDDPTYSNTIGAPASMPPPATYEMRASYRDRAIDLWNAVTANQNVYHPTRSVCQGHTPDVENTEVDCDMYEYGPQELDNFLLVDPSVLNTTPHPAQVMALSYLAHSAMMMTGWDVPFTSYSAGGRLDWDILTWAYYVPPGGGFTYTVDPSAGFQISSGAAAFQSKDAKLINPGTTAAAGQNNVQIKNDSQTDMCFYAGDEICFESDYREWFRRSTPAPTWQTAASGYTIDHSGFAGGPNGNLLASVRKYRVRSDLYVLAGQVGTITVDPPLVTTLTDTIKSWPDSWVNPHYNPPVQIAAPHPQQFIRVCNEHDRAFARKVHEMCMEWAQRYCADNPYDQGAPRMMNHQVMMDKPLEILDLFYDASAGAVSEGKAQRIPRNLPTSSNVSSMESFYRWMTPPNQEPVSWFQANHVNAISGNVHELSNTAPGRSSFSAWQSLVMNPQLAPGSSSGALYNQHWNWKSDETRYFPNRHFNPFHRARELIFWSVDWMSYADSETAPSAPLDWSKHARSIWLSSDGHTPLALKTIPNLADSGGGPQMTGSPWPQVPGMPWPAGQSWSWSEESQYAGNPEQGRLWANGNHNARWYDWVTAYNGQNAWSYHSAGADVHLGHWGADRNGNKALDIGPVPINSRMRAQTVARFNFYDPILRLNVNN